MKKIFLKIFLFGITVSLTSFIHAQKVFNVLDWKTDVTLNTYLVQKMHGQYEERKTILEKALHSKKETEAYIQSVRKKCRLLFGSFPTKSDLHAQVSGSVAGNGYTVEKILYESFPGHHVTASLYLPAGKGPFAAA